MLEFLSNVYTLENIQNYLNVLSHIWLIWIVLAFFAIFGIAEIYGQRIYNWYKRIKTARAKRSAR